MEFRERRPPRRFRVGRAGDIELEDRGSIALAPDEQVTFVTERGGEYDVVRKSWGFYATPSLDRDGRLARFGLRAALIRNLDTGRRFIVLVETGREGDFEAYRVAEHLDVVAWLDDGEPPAASEAWGRR